MRNTPKVESKSSFCGADQNNGPFSMFHNVQSIETMFIASQAVSTRTAIYIERQQAKSAACRPAPPRMGNDQYQQIVSEAGSLGVGVGGRKQSPVGDFPTLFR
ncbi:hypothetical protein [Paraburkholderia oxyphila]|uniref:hypothetical protein n=1 Tax=Paraburkholderia oxyphila TaxID=614212 RepID=UPI0012EDBCB0|nr:hypothetical protein [Paraburkholderia oxyphila]